jgi:hypothetical protein
MMTSSLPLKSEPNKKLRVSASLREHQCMVKTKVRAETRRETTGAGVFPLIEG